MVGGVDLPDAVRAAFPFESRFQRVAGGGMHYVDEGSGSPVLLLHGNPTWSFLYRRFIPPLAERHRVVAPDHLGFGLSDKPAGAPYGLEWHIRNLTDLIRALDLTDITLVVQDWGGPIGLGFATEHADRIAKLVVLNTWAFTLPGGAQLAPFLAWIREPNRGERLVLEENFLVERGIPQGIHDQKRVTPELMAAYRAPFPDARSRRSILAQVRDIPVGSSGQSAPRMAAIQAGLQRLKLPVCIIWGERDPVFSEQVLQLWRLHFPSAEVHLLADASHFLQEDAPDEIIAIMQEFLARHS